MDSLNSTPRASRLHIGLFGRRNSGKSSLINAITGQPVAIVSDIAGTTADPVYKSMELHGIGPVVFIDTAGLDDEGALGALRVAKTRDAMDKTDIAMLVIDAEPCAGAPGTGAPAQGFLAKEGEYLSELRRRGLPVITLINKADTADAGFLARIARALEGEWGASPLQVSARTGQGIGRIRERLIEALPEDYEAGSITGGLVRDGDRVLLVMPQDTQAPKGRLILPQVQTLRELLDRKCIVLSVTADRLDEGLASWPAPPALIITDSQVFRAVYEKKPAESRLTSFSVLFAAYKGDISYFLEGARAIDDLGPGARVLIAEACTHAPLREDIGREQLPRMLRAKTGGDIDVTVVSGAKWPEELGGFDLAIHCGACMFNRKYVLSRIEKARAAGLPMTNYGLAIAAMNGVLDKISV
ncbi:MAG: [FeFe] hydrogenase H-cluster maturation GTPase HydF [Clostridiales Family XIII bacterium]|jgi:[FeFe] hydrogenase H-cluster maturation GTPase HydF|nr:[FeFe] hydrogenase H-cluster maturation GTPase HydF [Clostridiales Family XIII bacterium]